MADQKRLAFSIIQFLHTQLQNGSMSPDAQESLEVAIQCLETAFGVSMEDQSLAVSQTLPEIFEAVAGKLEHSRTNSEPVTPSEDDVAEAERLKTEGNDQMKAENFEAAVSFYGKAIELNPANAVYFCNRAAAYSKLGNYAGAVRDCERAIGIDPSYSKAYGRMGLALSSLNKHTEAVVYYKKALELDPDNETYKSNLKIAEQKMKETPSPVSCGIWEFIEVKRAGAGVGKGWVGEWEGIFGWNSQRSWECPKERLEKLQGVTSRGSRGSRRAGEGFGTKDGGTGHREWG
uniref:Small glutamine-rich tetratricopeptide repeat-containing protein alpha n=1 Tax=Junco hyemalis TaxID=40217 RepID=A0A8C5NJ32_JUNHY